MSAQWAKLYTDILGDPKLLRAARKGFRELELLPWLIVFAKQSDDAGRLTVAGEPAEPEDIAGLLPGITPRRVGTALASLEAVGVLARQDDGALCFTAWSHRSGSKPSDGADAIRDRVQRHRQAKRNAGHSGNETPCNALQVTGGNATEEEEEKEEEKEKDTERVRETNGVTEPFATAWSLYPRRSGSNPRRDAEQAWRARLAEGVAGADMLAGVQRYAAWCEVEKQVGTKFVMQAATFFGPSRRFAESWETPDTSDEDDRDPRVQRIKQALAEQAAADARSAEWLEQRKRERAAVAT
jgi:hypothetical protein